MKAKLNKVDNGYVLLVDNIMYATDNDKLSKQNCDEIFGVVDVEKLAREHSTDRFKKSDCPSAFNQTSIEKDFIRGFNKAMELNKDKLFTLEDMQKAFELGHNGAADTYMLEKNEQEFEKLIQQPTEIDVEIEMVFLGFEMGSGLKMEEPKLDSNGNLILRKL
jgi:SpoU rRNA methylase family enzyme